MTGPLIVTCADQGAGAEGFYDIQFLNEHIVLPHSLRYNEETSGDCRRKTLESHGEG